MSFAKVIHTGEATAQAKTLARAAVRSVMRDAVFATETIEPHNFATLVRFTEDRSLVQDTMLPASVQRVSLLTRDEVLQIRIAASDIGATAISDAAFLPDGRLLAAFGEAGARLLTCYGRTVAHFDQPVHKLVLSDYGDRAIALAKRGDIWRLAKFDFLARRAEDWCEARVDAWANDYDG